MDVRLEGGLAAHASDQGGIFTRQQALSHGYTDAEIQRLVRNGVWRRLRRGIFVDAALWDRLSSPQQHILHARAALRHVDPPAAASHWTAAAVHGLDTYLPDLSLVHLTRSGQHSPRLEAGVHHHAARLDQHEATVVDDIPVTSIARTVVDIACLPVTNGFESGLVTADCALRLGLEPAVLRDQLLSQTDWRGARTAGRVVSRADGRSESVGETLSRAAFLDLGLPEPDLQKTFYDPSGSVFARVDFYWPQYHVVVEFDGKAKYLRDLAPGEDPGERVWSEKRREDRLRDEYGVEVVRIVWADLLPENRARLAHRIKAAFARAERRRLRLAS